jgi:hypothetical protein
MFGGMLLVGWEHSTPKLPRGSSCDFIWKLDLNDLVWTEVLYGETSNTAVPPLNLQIICALGVYRWKNFLLLFFLNL